MVRLLILCGMIAEMALTPLAQAAPPAAYAQNPATSRPPLPPAAAVATTPATAAAPSATMTTTAAALSASATLVATPMSSAATTTTTTATAGVSATVAPTATATVTPGSALSATAPPTATIDANAIVTPPVSSLVTATMTATGTATATATLTPSVTDAATPPTGTLVTVGGGAAVTPTIDGYDHLPLAFEPNQGQTDASVQFLSHGPGFSLYLTGTGATLGVVSRPHTPHRHDHARDQGLGRGLTRADALTETASISATSIRLRYDGADPHARSSGDDQLPGVATYLIGADPSRWQVDVPTYARVSYHDVYPGVDLVYYGTVGRLEYDWRLAAGADPGRITLAVDGARRVSLDAAGNLVLGTALGPIVQQAPAAYQEDGGQRVPVDVRYTLTGTNRAGFAVGAYDTRKPLVIDPVLTYSTYLGGGGTDYGNGIAVDGAGAAYVVGDTDSTTFPTTPGVVQTGQGGSACGTGPCTDAFVSKISADGRSLLYSTYLGGSGNDGGTGIAVDGLGDAYLTGYTDSTTFPLVSPFQTTAAGSFVAKLGPRGNALLYSSYLGSSNGATTAEAIALDAAGSAYVTGYTAGTNFPTVNALQAANASTVGLQDAFVSKVSASGSALVYSTYLGGSNNDIGRAITVDGAGAAYVAGDSYSTDFPTTSGAVQRTFGGGQYDAFVAKLTPAGTALAYSTYLGGSDNESGNGLALDGAGAAYVVGDTGSTNFPTTAGALQGRLKGAGCGAPLCTNAYATKLNPSGSALVYSTYLGGTGGAGNGDSASAVAVDSAGDAYLVGTTSSPDFPTADAVQSRYGGGNSDAFVTELNVSGTAPVYSTYLGGSSDDFGDGIAIDAAGSAYVTGYTYGGFPTSNAVQPGFGGGSQDAFVTKIRATRSGSVPWHPHSGGMGAVGGGVDLQVDLADGHLDARMAGLSLSGRGPDIAIERTWDSNLAGAGGGGLAASVTPRMGGVLTATVSYTDGSGAVWPFVYTGSLSAPPPYTAYATPAGQPWQLTAATNGYTLTNFLTSEFWAFDSQGRLTGDTDAYGNKVGYSYGASSATSPNSVVNSGGRAALLGYTNGQLTDVQSPLWASSGGAQGQHVTYGYTGSQLTSLTRGAGTSDAQTTTFGYSGTLMTSITTAANRVWGIGYDASGRVSNLTSPVSGTAGQPGYTPAYTTQYTYSPARTTIVEGAGTTAAVTTTYTLDAAGEATGVTDGLGNTSRSTYDADHDMTTSADANGNTTTNKYQYIGPNGAVGQIVEEDQPAIQAYSPQNGVLVSPVITHTYDPSTHDLLATGQPEGGVTKYAYDGHHGVVATTEQTTQNTCATTCATTWRGTMSSYDAYGQVTSTTDGRGVSVDANGNATLVDPGGQYTSRTNYDAQGDQTSSSTPPITTTLNGITTTAPVSSVTAYDADGNPTLRVDANGNQTTTTYDHLGRPIATGRPAVALWDGSTQATRVTTATVDDSAQGAGQDQFSYTGNWGHCANCGPSLYGRSNSWDGTANDAATLAFSGTAVALYGVKDTNNGIAAVSLDGGAETMVDLYASARTYTVLIWSAGGLAAGRHSLKLRVTGSKNASSSGYLVGPDRADIGVPSAPAGTTTYDAVGNAVSSTDANGATTTSDYDPLGRLVAQTNPVGGAMRMTYTADELTAQSDPQGNVTAYGYDAAGRQVQMTNPVTGTVQSAYDAAGNTTALTTTDRTNGNAAVTLETMGYDALDRAITSTVVTDTANMAGSALTTLTRYDGDGNVAQTVQPNGDTVYNTYDAADRLQAVETDPQPVTKGATNPSKYESYTYDNADNPTGSTDADGRTTATQYDGDGRVAQAVATSSDASGATTITTTERYDPDGNTVGTTTTTRKPDGSTETHTSGGAYDATGNPTGASDDGATTTYGYDAAGQERTEASADGTTAATLGYDAAGRVTAVTDTTGAAAPYVTGYTYNANSLPLTVLYPNGTGASLSYDPNSALTSLTATGPAQTPATTTLQSSYAYGYNAAGWIVSSTTLSGTDALTHDAAGRLTDECGPQMVTPSKCDHWTYDKNGNVLTAVGDSGATDVYTYTAAGTPGGQINAQVAGGSSDSPPTATIRLAYDQNGDTTSISNAVAQTANPTDPGYIKYARNERFAYDALQRPITVTRLDSARVNGQTIVTPLTATLQYNADGLRADYRLTPDPRTGKTAVDTRFAYRAAGELASATTTDMTGTLLYKNTFVYGPSGEPLELIRTDPTGTSRYWYALDGLGSVVALTDSSGKVVDRYAYDSWGEETSNDATAETVPQQLRYRGYYYDEKLTYYWLGARYYDPEGMRYLQPDPTDLDGTRTYDYALDDPLDALDVMGLFTCPSQRVHIGPVPIIGSGKTLYEACRMLHVEVIVGTFNLFVGDDIDTVLYSHNTAYRVEAFASILLLVVPPAKLLKLLKLTKFARPVVVKLINILAKLARAHLPPGGADRALRLLENGHKGLGFGYKILRKPVVHDPYLQRVVNDLWRPGATVGNGGAADALLQEARTGVPVTRGDGGFHYPKAKGYLNGLRTWLRNHPDTDPDYATAQAIFLELRHARETFRASPYYTPSMR